MGGGGGVEGNFSVSFGPKLGIRLWIWTWTKLNKKYTYDMNNKFLKIFRLYFLQIHKFTISTKSSKLSA